MGSRLSLELYKMVSQYCVYLANSFKLLKCGYFNAVPSTAPKNVTAVAVNSSAISAMWEQLPADQQNGIIKYYTVVVQVQQTSATFSVNTTDSSITIPDLHPAYDHTLRIAAVTVGTGPLSIPVTVTTPDDSKRNALICFFF